MCGFAAGVASVARIGEKRGDERGDGFGQLERVADEAEHDPALGDGHVVEGELHDLGQSLAEEQDQDRDQAVCGLGPAQDGDELS